MEYLKKFPDFSIFKNHETFLTKLVLPKIIVIPQYLQSNYKPHPNIQKEINSKEIQNLNLCPNGIGKILSYTIIQGRKNLEYGIVVGELEDKSRFIANTPKDENLLKMMTKKEMLGLKGVVSSVSGKNIFKPNIL